MNRLASFLLLAVFIGAGGCSVPHRMPEVGDLPIVHKIDIQQGNVVTQEMLSQLQVGMEKNKVLFVMGTPVIKDTFHANRWDYLYVYKPGRKDAERRHIVLYFEDDKLARIEGDVRPSPGPMEPIMRENRQVVVPNPYHPGFVSRMIKKLPFVKNEEATPDIPKKPVAATVASKSAAEDDDTTAVEPEKPSFFKRIFSKSEPEAPTPAPASEKTAKSEPPAETKSPTTAKSADEPTKAEDKDTTKSAEPEYGNIMNRGPVLDSPGAPGDDEGSADPGPMPPPPPHPY